MPIFNKDFPALEALADLTAQPAAKEGQLTVDVFQTAAEIIIQSAIAGVSQSDLDISLTREMVTIKGSRPRPETATAASYDHRELYWGAFSRAIILPMEVDVDKAKATLKNGLLTIRLPKLA